MIELRHPVTGLPTGVAVDPANLPELPGWALAQIDEARRDADRQRAERKAWLCEAVRQLVAGGHPEDVADDALWQAFWQINRGRQQGMAGWQPLPATEMLAWATLTRTEISPDDWRTIIAMDRAFMTAEPGSADKPELTPELFDAMFS